jgi:hypothetical protein
MGIVIVSILVCHHITLGANKGNMMHCSIVHTMCLRKEMLHMNNNVMSFSNLNIFDLKCCQ